MTTFDTPEAPSRLESIIFFISIKLFNLEGKREYVRLLRTSNTNLWQFSRLIYQRCIHSEINNMIIDIKDKNRALIEFYALESIESIEPDRFLDFEEPALLYTTEK